MKIHWDYVLTGLVVIGIYLALKPHAEKVLKQSGMWEESYEG
jgi:hypothetical protein